jgi:DNA-binding SARP family transcriptional activator
MGEPDGVGAAKSANSKSDLREAPAVETVAGGAQRQGLGQDPLPAVAGLRRDRLLRALERIPTARLGLVIAPAGSGKTTLLADWARDRGPSVAWCRATRADTADSLLGRAVAHWGLDPRAARSAGILAEVLAEASTQRVLLVDDVHHLGDGSARRALEHIAQSAPPQTSLLLSSRRDLTLDLVHAEVSANPVVLGPEDLRFRSWEVESLFRDVYGVPLGPDDAAALARHTGGWAAALHLFHLSTCRQSPGARHRAVEALASRSRYARGYLSRQVLDGLGNDASTFLRRTSIFELLTAARCDALLERSDSQSVLEDLVSCDAFTTTDDGGASFRCHEVLRSHLEADLEADLGDLGMLTWCSRAAEILEEEGAVVEALRVRARARDWAGVSRLVSRSGGQIAPHQSTWTGLLPDPMLKDDPWIQLAVAQQLVADGRLAEAADAVRACRDSVDDPRAEERIRAILAVTRAWRQLECPPSRRWFEQVAAAMRSLRPPPAGTPSSHADEDDLARPFLLLLQGRIGAARDATRYAAGLDAEASPPAMALALVEGLAGWLQGDPWVHDIADQVAGQAESARLGWFVRASRALVAATDQDPRNATAELRRVISQSDARGDPWGAVWASCLLGLHELQSERPSPGPLLEAAERARERGARTLHAWLTAFAALVAVRFDSGGDSGRVEAALAVAQEAGVHGAAAVCHLAAADADGDPIRTSAAEAACTDAGVTYQPWRHWEQPPTCPTVSVRLLAGFSLTVDGVPVDLVPLRPQARQLLRMLALNAGHPMHRERLAELMWPAQPATSAIHRLQVAVSSLRRGIGDDASEHPPCDLVQRDGESYRFPVSDRVRVDVLDFRRAVDKAREARRMRQLDREVELLTTAVELYAGDLLPEDGPAEWVVEEREQLRALASTAAAALAARLAATEPREAIAAAQRSLAIDPLNDAAWQQLISLHEDLGDLAQAERARAAYEEVLRELGLSDLPPAPRQARV